MFPRTLFWDTGWPPSFRSPSAGRREVGFLNGEGDRSLRQPNPDSSPLGQCLRAATAEELNRSISASKKGRPQTSACPATGCPGQPGDR